LSGLVRPVVFGVTDDSCNFAVRQLLPSGHGQVVLTIEQNFDHLACVGIQNDCCAIECFDGSHAFAIGLVTCLAVGRIDLFAFLHEVSHGPHFVGVVLFGSQFFVLISHPSGVLLGAHHFDMDGHVSVFFAAQLLALPVKVTGFFGTEPEATDDYLLKVDNPLVVPVNQKIRIITTSNDVIHSFAVNSFGIKQDAIPGFVRDTWFRAEKTGDFYGQCQELCGKEHAYMPIHVKVVSAQEYTAWVADQNKKLAAKQDDPNKVWTMADLMQKGEKVYAANCQACHQANGKGMGPIKTLDGAAVVLDADAGKVIKVLLNGQNNLTMPAWKQLSDSEIAAVISYTKNNWSNKTGQLVQPAQVLAARQ